MFNKVDKSGKSCNSCHSESSSSARILKGFAPNYPKYSSNLNKSIAIEERNNICLSKYMTRKPYKIGSRESNLLSRYVKFLSRNIPISINSSEFALASIAKGKKIFSRKVGQYNFSCAICHTASSQKWLRGILLSIHMPKGKLRTTATTWPRHFIGGKILA